jgi:flagellar M-ring protein FliF
MAQSDGVLAELTIRQRVALGLATIALAGICVVSYLWLYQAEYRALYDNLNEEDAAKVLLQLQDMKVPYKLANEGHTILVESQLLEETRVLLDGGSLSIKGGDGFELFDDIDYGMTDFAQKINYQRAMQGELSRTIIGLKEVRYARVHLVLSEKGLFQQSTTLPKASITIVQEPGYVLSRSQIQGIQKLVASAVEGMEPAYVTLISGEGVLLSQNQESDEAGIGSKLGQKQEVEQYLSAKAEKILNQLFGYGRAVVNIDVSLNYDEVQLTRETFLPAQENGERGMLVRSKTQRKYAETGGQSENKSSDKPYSETTEHDYQVSKSIEQIVKASGSFNRMTVSVMVPDDTSAEDIESLSQLVINAVGLDSRRGDTIEIGALPAVAIETLGQSDKLPGIIESVPKVAIAAGISDVAKVGKNYTAPLQLGLLLLLLVLVIAGLLYTFLPAKKEEKSTLSEQQRRELLDQIKDWMVEEPPATPVENA